MSKGNKVDVKEIGEWYVCVSVDESLTGKKKDTADMRISLDLAKICEILHNRISS
jgi:hypothetical protein